METLPVVSDHSAHFRPMPVDTVLCPTRQDAPIEMPPALIKLASPKARAEVAVFKDTGSEWIPESYERSPWAVVRLLNRELYMSAWFCHTVTSFTMPDISNTSQTMQSAGITSNGFNGQTPNITLRWGSNNTAATNADRDLLTFVDTMTVTAPTFDLTNIIAVASSSKIYTGTATTLREVGQAASLANTSSVLATFLQDRTVISDVAVAQNRTVAIEYTWTF